jgi:uncharacterized membrane-anchored protein YhcB (DUF1043 family)
LEFSEFALGLISGLIISIITQIIAHYFSKKSLEAQQEYSLRIAKMQLYHEDTKNALNKLDELLKKNYNSFMEFRDDTRTFLDGSFGLFLPDKLKEELKKEMQDIDQFLFDKEIELYGEPSEEWLQTSQNDYEAWFESLSPKERVDEEVKERLSSLKSSMRKKIEKYISTE